MYPCFCSDEELDAMRAAAEAANLPPVYNGRWARATAEQVEEEMAKGTPYCFRFRVPANKTVVVRDLVRGDVKFNTDTLGDFVVMRSNGLPVRSPPLERPCWPRAAPTSVSVPSPGDPGARPRAASGPAPSAAAHLQLAPAAARCPCLPLRMCSRVCM